MKVHFVENFLDQIIVENTNLSEYQVRHLQEETKNRLTDKIVTKLFNDIKNKMLSVDCDYIDRSRGDITKLKNYDTIENAINYLQKYIINNKDIKNSSEFKQATETLAMSFNIAKKYKKEFTMGYRLTNPAIIYLYDSLVISLIEGSSFVIAESVEFVKNNLNLYETKVKHNIKNLNKNNYIKSLRNFNELEKKNLFNKFFKDVQNLKEAFSLNGLLGVSSLATPTGLLSIIGLIAFVLYTIKSIIFLYYDTRVKLSEYLLHLKNFVEMNLSTLDNDAKKVKEKQTKVAKLLQKLADKISIDQKVSNDRANNAIKETNKEITIEDDDSEDDLGGLQLY